jgi:hypothetical protein
MAQKVTGLMRNLPRKKLCVPSTLEQASLLDVTPFAIPWRERTDNMRRTSSHEQWNWCCRQTCRSP